MKPTDRIDAVGTLMFELFDILKTYNKHCPEPGRSKTSAKRLIVVLRAELLKMSKELDQQ